MASNYDAYVDNAGVNEDSGSSGRSQKDKLRQKRSMVTRAFQDRKSNGWDRKWEDQVKIYSNQYPWEEIGDYEDIVVPNMVFSTVNVIVPSIAVHNPKITVTANQREDEASSDLVEAVVNHQWRDLKVQEQVTKAVKDFILIGHGWIEVSWDVEVEERDLTIPEWQMMAQQALMQRAEAMQTSSLSDDEFPSEQEVLEGLPSTTEEVVRDQPLVKRVSPFDMIVDPDALTLEDARWIVQRQYVPIEEARENEEWQPGARRKLKPKVMSQSREVDVGPTEETKPTDAGFAVVYKFYDLNENKTCVFAEGVDEFLVKPVKSPFPGGHPYVMLKNYEVPERFFPIGDVETIYGLQLELGRVRTQLINDRKRGGRINLYRSADIGPDGVDDIMSGADNVMVEVLSERPFDDVFRTLQPTGLDFRYYDQSEMILGDINMTTGVSEYDRGLTPEGRRTATEVGVIQDQANARKADKLARVEAVMGDVAERMIRLSQVFMDSQAVARVVSDEQVVDWIQYDRSKLQGSFTFTVEAGSSQPQDESVRRQSAFQMMEMLSGLFGTGYLNDQKILEHVLRNGFGIKTVEDYLGPGPMPMPPPGPEGAGGAPPMV